MRNNKYIVCDLDKQYSHKKGISTGDSKEFSEKFEKH